MGPITRKPVPRKTAPEKFRKNKNAKSEKCEIGKMDRQKTAARNPGPPFDKDRVPINKGDRDH
jgi:hypothetical protein